jgi:hypothetical protein
VEHVGLTGRLRLGAHGRGLRRRQKRDQRGRQERKLNRLHSSLLGCGVPDMTATSAAQQAAWPALPYAEWRDTRDTLHMWTQVAGKLRMALSPPVNHWWHVPLYVTARGLSTSPIPYGERSFELVFDFCEHRLHC